MSAISDIYDYITPIEDAVRTVFEAAQITIWTPLSDPEFQKARPRVEAVLMPGAALGHLLPTAGRRVSPGHLREQARRAQLLLYLISKADITEHRSYVASILFLLDTMAFELNATDKLPNHAISALKVMGGSLSYKPEDGTFTSNLTCEIDFSVKTTAWAALG